MESRSSGTRGEIVVARLSPFMKYDLHGGAFEAKRFSRARPPRPPWPPGPREEGFDYLHDGTENSPGIGIRVNRGEGIKNNRGGIEYSYI